MNFPIVRGWQENFDRWSWVHFFGPALLAWIWGPAAAFVLVVVWELLDTAYALGRSSLEYFIVTTSHFGFLHAPGFLRFVDRRIFDPRGFSYGDVICGAGGILLFLFIRAIFT